MFDYRFQCKTCCHRKILGRKGVNVSRVKVLSNICAIKIQNLV